MSRPVVTTLACALVLLACKSDETSTSTSSSSGANGSGGTSSGNVRETGPTKTVGCASGPCECKAGEDCQQSCTVAGCAIVCRSQSVCTATCQATATTCSQTCESGADCNFNCLGGGCSMTCKTGSTCKMACGGTGACTMSCEGGAACTADCAGGNCTCNGVKC